MKNKYFVLILILLPIFTFSQEATLNVLGTWKKHSDTQNALYHHYLSEVVKLMDEREVGVSKLTTQTDWEQRKKEIRIKLSNALGTLPKKSPLNARIIGISKNKDYSVEKIIFESQPGFHVTAALYIPNKLKEKVPAIIHVIGHSQTAFKRIHYQRSAINFVKKGFIVLTFDPIGQGERAQYFSSNLGKSDIGGTATEHIYMGLQTLLLGKTLANYFVWDGIRAVDYLMSRKEVDSTRIGITGLSGGGTQATFIAAFDNRIYATAPSCYITSMRRLFESIGPQDAEQNLYHALANKIDFADLLEVRVPKPALVVTTSRDFFSVQGAIETATEIEKVYTIYNAKDNFGRVEADSTHSMPSLNREARHKFFQKNLNFPGIYTDVEVEYLDKELLITETGQLATSIGGETVFSINKKEAKELIDKLVKSRKKLDKHLQNVKKSAKELSGYTRPNKVEDIVFTGRFKKKIFTIEKYFIKGEGDYPIPFILYLPNNITHAPILYLNKNGKSNKDKVNNSINDEIPNDIEWYVNHGHPVLTADLIGFGEMSQKGTSWPKFGTKYGGLDYSVFFASAQLNRSIVGIHAGDIERLVLFLKQDKRFDTNNLFAIAFGRLLTSSLLHAAAFEEQFSKIILVDPLVSYRSIVMNRYFYSMRLSSIVPGALTAYDLPDLAALVAPNQLIILNVRDHMNTIISDGTNAIDLKIVKSAFEESEAINNLKIINLENKEDIKYLFNNSYK